MTLKETLKALRKIKNATEDYEIGDMLGDILSVYSEAGDDEGEEDDV